MIPLLSILICTITKRVNDNLPALINELSKQADNLPVQILYLGDNKSMNVGQKRNELVQLSDGRYITFVDDDDSVSSDYVSELLEAIKTNADVIVFDVMKIDDGVKDKSAHYSFEYDRDSDSGDFYKRLPNHLMCFRRDVALRQSFMNINFGEDTNWARQIKQYCTKEVRIDKVLYNYNFSKKGTETQQHIHG